MRSSKRLLLPSLLALALAACGGEKPAATPALPAGLATFKVEAGQGLPGRGWDGVVEAVRQGEGCGSQSVGQTATGQVPRVRHVALASVDAHPGQAAQVDQGVTVVDHRRAGDTRVADQHDAGLHRPSLAEPPGSRAQAAHSPLRQ